MTALFPRGLDDGYVDFPLNDFAIRISSPERAAMEMLYYVPLEQGFDEAERIMESLLTLRPALVQKLLETCNSVKVKRLFMYMAEKSSLPCVERLDLGKVDFGKGDRTVLEGGRLDPKYRITIPRGGAG
jgi:Transcriptional regulator, AbiEi antitoxin, Type IV TA system